MLLPSFERRPQNWENFVAESPQNRLEHLKEEFFGDYSSYHAEYPNATLLALSGLCARGEEALLEHWTQKRDDGSLLIIDLLRASTGPARISFCSALRCLELPLGHKLLRSADSSGVTIRVVLSGLPETRLLLAQYGTFLSRFDVVDHELLHQSETCRVQVAQDVVDSKEVVLKLMNDQGRFEREVKARKSHWFNGMVDMLEPEGLGDELAKNRCVVLPKGSKSLFDAISTERFAGHDMARIRTVAWELATLVHALHTEGRLIHADLKPRNIMRMNTPPNSTFKDGRDGSMELTADPDAPLDLAGQSEWKLIDFDASVMIGKALTEKFSSGYVPPEQMRVVRRMKGKVDKVEFAANHMPEASPAVDVWSFGVILFELLSGTSLFHVDKTDDNLVEERDELELINWLTVDRVRMKRIEKNFMDRPELADLVRSGKDLVRMCLQGDPVERISFEEMLREHPFFDGLATDGQASKGFATAGLETDGRATDASPDVTTVSKMSAKDGRRISSRILSLRRRITSRQWQAVNNVLAKGKRKKAKTAAATTSEEPLTSSMSPMTDVEELQRYHFFLSYMQAEAAGVVKDLWASLLHARCSTWLDMLANDVTTPGMRRGVALADTFLMVLTESVLTRPFCLMELFVALEQCKRLIFVVEEDSRFKSVDHRHPLPWVSGDESKDAKAKAEIMEGLRKLEEPAEEVLKAVEDLFAGEYSKVTSLAYRRRGFESDAMVRQIMDCARLVHATENRDKGRPVRTDPDNVAMLAKEGSAMGLELKRALTKRIGADVPLINEPGHQEPEVLLVFLEEGLLSSSKNKQFLHRWVVEERRPFLIVQHSWWGSRGAKAAQEELDSELYTELFVNTEILPYRPAGSIESKLPNFIAAHEHHALVAELHFRSGICFVDEPHKKQLSSVQQVRPR
ncbi:Calcium-dependent protein kinase 12 (OsCDPK12) (OsCPK12), partial [Durusdinium trenchii]